MPEVDIILTKLDSMEKRLGSIETAVAAIAVQDNKINNIQHQITEIYHKQDNLTGPDGIISRIREHQAGCPKPQLTRIWWAIGLTASLYAATLVIVMAQIGH